MYTSRYSREFLSAMRKAGERIAVEIDGVTYSRRAVVENAGKNFMRKYDDEFNIKRDTGNNLRRDKIAFIPYFNSWDDTAKTITICYRRKRYVVVADSIMTFGDHPVFIWALMREVSVPSETYYSENICGDDE